MALFILIATFTDSLTLASPPSLKPAKSTRKKYKLNY